MHRRGSIEERRRMAVLRARSVFADGQVDPRLVDAVRAGEPLFLAHAIEALTAQGVVLPVELLARAKRALVGSPIDRLELLGFAREVLVNALV